MKRALSCSALLAFSLTGTLLAAGPVESVQVPGLRAARARVDVSGRDLGVSVSDDSGWSPATVRWLLERARPGDGGGADVSFGSLVAIQRDYVSGSRCPFDCDQEMEGIQTCNRVLIAWDEESFNPDGVDIYVDETLVANVPGLDEEQLPGTNQRILTGVPAGEHMIRVEETNEGTFDELSMTVVDEKPFSDATNLQIFSDSGEEEGACDTQLAFVNRGPLPTYNLVFIDGTPVFEFPNPEEGYFFQNVLGIQGLAEDTYGFSILGFLEAEPGDPRRLYSGCVVSREADVVCDPTTCRSPRHAGVVQLDHDASDNFFLGIWTNGEASYPGGVTILQGGSPLGTVGSEAQSAIFGGPLAPGDYLLGLRGECSDESSLVFERPFTALGESPNPEPVDGAIETTYDPETRTSTSVWTNAERAEIVFAVLLEGGEPPELFVAVVGQGGLAGEEMEFTLEDVDADDVVGFRFVRFMDGQGHSSPLITDPGETGPALFVRGNCDGNENPNPQITDAVFLLARLFTAGRELPCPVACDVDANGALNLTDAVGILNYLFLAGPAPAGWVDREPTCEPFGPQTPGGELGCATPLAICEAEGPAL